MKEVISNTPEGVASITEANVVSEDPWEAEVARAEYHGAIKVYKADKDEASMASSFFTAERLPIEIVDGKVFLKLKVSKDGMSATNAITALSQKSADGSYIPLSLEYLDSDELRYVITTVEITDIETAVSLKCTINTGWMTMEQELRILLTEDTINRLKAEMGETKKQIEMEVSYNDETKYGANDGSIVVIATGGKGKYEYSIDGGASWQGESTFKNLAPGIYEVAVRDAEEITNVTAFEKVVIGKKENTNLPISEGEYKVNFDVLHETLNQDSMAASYFQKEEARLIVRDEKAYLRLMVARDSGNMKDIIQGLDIKVGDDYKALPLAYEEVEDNRYIVTEIPLDTLDEAVYVRCHIVLPFMTQTPVARIQLTAESIEQLMGEKESPVQITVDKTEGKSGTGCITVTATGGSGKFEYTNDQGKTWVSEATFTNLANGTYYVAARDAENVNNISAYTEVVIESKDSSNSQGLADGYYSANIDVLHETKDQTSMAAQFFNTEGLPLYIQGGKAYLTIQVLKDGMGMRDVITSLEQRVNGEYEALDLNYLQDSSKRYVTAKVEFSSVEDTAYLRCGISAVGGLNPVLRIKLTNINEGAGSIKYNLAADSTTAIEKVEAVNGKVIIHLLGDCETLTENDFTAKVYLNGSTKGSDLTLKNFKIKDQTITFDYDAIKAADQNQSVVIGITFNNLETQSNAFTINGIEKSEEGQNSLLSLKANAKEIKYINGYEDGTFRAGEKVTKAEALNMLAMLVDGVQNSYYTADIKVLQAEKNETSIAGQFFKTEKISISKNGDKYKVELEIANEGLGFSNIITSIEQKIDGKYESIEVRKSDDKKKAYITIEISSLDETITLKTGIAPMGSVAPELRILIKQDSIKEAAFTSQFTDIDMWAKDAITLFEEAGVVSGVKFYPDEAITRMEFVKIITQVAGLELENEAAHTFKDLKSEEENAYVGAAVKAGLIQGYENQTFKPNNPLTRAEAVTIINRLTGNSNEAVENAENPFSDLKASHWAYEEILKAAKV